MQDSPMKIVLISGLRNIIWVQYMLQKRTFFFESGFPTLIFFSALFRRSRQIKMKLLLIIRVRFWDQLIPMFGFREQASESCPCHKLEAGGKPSTWFPPGELVELSRILVHLWLSFCWRSRYVMYFVVIIFKKKHFEFSNTIFPRNRHHLMPVVLHQCFLSISEFSNMFGFHDLLSCLVV